MSSHIEIQERDIAFRNRLQTFSIVNRDHIDVSAFLNDAFSHIQTRIEDVLRTQFIIKVGVSLVANFEKTVLTENGEKQESQTMYLNTSSEIIDFETNLREYYDEYIVDFLLRKIEDVELRGSGFALSEIIELNIQISSYEPYTGSSYIKMPVGLEFKRAVINVKNDDHECFKYAVLSALYPAERNAQRVSQYWPYKNKLDFTNIQFPVDLKGISKFEQQNQTISINVYTCDGEENRVRTLRLTKKVKQNHIHLLLLTEKTNKNSEHLKTHYCWIKNLSALLCSQISTNGHALYFCDRCLNHFMKPERLERHKIECMKRNECEIVMPMFPENIIKFRSYKKQLMVPFIVYADVESILKKPDIKFCKSESTFAYQQHESHSVGYYFKCNYDDSKSYYRSQRGPKCINWFANEMSRLAGEVDDILNDVKPLNMSLEDEVYFILSEECHICGERFKSLDDKVRDHSHLTGIYRGAAHSECNLKLQEARYIPIVFHNLSNYDAHFIIKAVANEIEGEVKVIPRTDQLYIAFTKTIKSTRSNDYQDFVKLRFIDSLRFMASSLDYLTSLLPAEKKKNLRSECKTMSEEQVQLLERKGVFCYDYIDSWDRLNEKALPSKDKFHSSLTDSDISDEDYEFAIKVWNTFKIKTLGEYSDLYMKTDILLLADVFENFRETCYNIYSLDPAHYFTAPSLSFDAMLKYTKVKIHSSTDIDMLLFIEKGIRGGISHCSKRHSKANNKHMREYDEKNESKYLVYLDANNLYGYSMMQHLPIDSFQWSQKKFDSDSIMQIASDSLTGYIFEVDLDYPQHLHDEHKGYPFCPESQTVPNTKNDKKLLSTLHNKKNYVIHYKMLQCALRNGLVLKKIHKVLEFAQSEWLKPYIELNTMLRTQAKNEFEKNFYKLLINAIYGKTMENMRSRIEIFLKTKWKGRYGASKLIALPNFKKYTIFDENLTAIELNKVEILMDKPIAIGMAILDISKVLMYDFYYGHLKAKYGDKIEMIYTDTDSFILEINTDCFYSDMLIDLNKFDTSDYSESNSFNIPRVNKKIPGLFKDELNGKIMTEFVGLRSKMYSVKTEGITSMKKAKGIKKNVLAKTIGFDDYLKCIRDNCTITRSQNTFRCKKHTVFTVKQVKIALSPFDNKRYILDDNVHTLPWGHYKIVSE